LSARAFALVLLLATAACNGPLPFLSGGKLAGDDAPVPAGWSGVADHGTAQLETRPSDPYSINLVYTVLDGRVYVNAGGNEAQWVENMEADPLVRLRIDDKVYDLRAERVTARAEIEAFARAWTSQSTFRRDPSKVDPVYIYRLVPR
jgi:hypothetical protein